MYTPGGFQVLSLVVLVLRFRPSHNKEPHKKLSLRLRGEIKFDSCDAEVSVGHTISHEKKSGLKPLSRFGGPVLYSGRYPE